MRRRPAIAADRAAGGGADPALGCRDGTGELGMRRVRLLDQCSKPLIKAARHRYRNLRNLQLSPRDGLECAFGALHIACSQRRVAFGRGARAAGQQEYGEGEGEKLAIDHPVFHITQAAAHQRGCKIPRGER